MAEEIFGRFNPPQSGFLVDTRAGHDNMDMRMILSGSGIGVQDCCKAGFPLKRFVIPGECFQDILHTVKHQGIDLSLMSPGKIAEFLGQGKRDEIIFGGQAFA
jgi:hypothetical protein